jgi:predicted deacylase
MKIDVIRGNNSHGKHVVILGGVHGDEITPIYHLSKMVKENLFNVESIRKLTIVNSINMSGLRNKSREMHSNGTSDINRSFSNINQEDAIAKLKKYLDHPNVDAIIDTHSSPSCAEFALIDIDEYTMSMKDWCDKANVPTAFRYSGANTIKRYCLEKGKLSLTLEINKLNKIDYDSANRSIDIVNGLLDTVDEVILAKTKPNVKELVTLKTYTEGILFEKFKNGDVFKKGDILYEISDLNLDVIYSHKAEFDGILLVDSGASYVVRGDSIWMVQPL